MVLPRTISPLVPVAIHIIPFHVIELVINVNVVLPKLFQLVPPLVEIAMVGPVMMVVIWEVLAEKL